MRPIRALVDEALLVLPPDFERLYSKTGRPSIAPEKLLRALLLQAFYTIRSERQLMEQPDYNLLFRWFVGLSMDERVTADFAGGSISSDGGLVLLRAAKRRLGLAEALAGCMREWRDPDRVVHTLPAMLRFRMFAIACGYDDADDCDALRGDPLFKLVLGRAPESGRDLCSQTAALAQALHADIGVMDQPSRALLRSLDRTADQARRPQIDGRARSRHRAIHQRLQPKAPTVPLGLSPPTISSPP